MPENWELHKDVIRELYITRGYTLEELRKTMSIKHGVTASPRTYKMKLDEWNMRKNRRTKKLNCKEGNSKTAWCGSVSSAPDCSAPTDKSSASVSREISLSGESSPSSTLSSPRTPIEVYHQPFPFETVPSSTPDLHQISSTRHNIIVQQPSSDANDLGPIVNSSLMFFSSRTDSRSLHLLAKFPSMAPRAIEILLRNWKPGGEHMQYALRFLGEPAYCHTLLSVNWTRWTHRDETLFDLVDEYVPEDEQAALTVAILRADLTFQYPLEPLHAAWASNWRLALRQTDPEAARAYLLQLGAHSRLISYALYVLSSSIVHCQSQIMSGIGNAGDHSVDGQGHIPQILSDSRDPQADWNHGIIAMVTPGVR